jgi:signal transduction histidine kinase
MVLQAGAERRVLGDERPDTTAALRDIESTGRQALGELRRLLGIVRTADGEPPLEPQPTLADLGTLIEQINHAGLTTELHADGQRRPLPPGLELSAYRIVQEALTNVLKHSSAHAACVIVRYRPGALELEVTDDGTATGSASENGGGHGLVGMRERAALFDGTLTAGPRPAGGYAVAVRLPLEPGG